MTFEKENAFTRFLVVLSVVTVVLKLVNLIWEVKLTKEGA